MYSEVVNTWAEVEKKLLFWVHLQILYVKFCFIEAYHLHIF